MKQQSTQLTLAFATVIMGCLLLIAGFIAPPMGEISPTVLTAFGECLTFAGALCGIDYRYRKDTPKPPQGGGCNDATDN